MAGETIKYVGSADVRVLTSANLKAVGVQDVPEEYEARWDALNDYTVKREDLGVLDDEQFARIIGRDPGFYVIQAPVQDEADKAPVE